jgi:hypothetical protein
VSHLLWSSSAVAEVYSLNAVFFFALALAAVAGLRGSGRGTFLFGLIAGVSLLHHRTIQITAFGMFLALVVPHVRRRRPRPPPAPFLLGVVAGLLPLVLLVAFHLDEARAGGLQRTLLGSFHLRPPSGLGFGRGLLGLLLYEARFLAFNLLGPQLLLAAVGLHRVAREDRGVFLLLLLPALFALPQPLVFPHLGDRYVLLLPTVCSLAVFAGVGAAVVARPRPAPVRAVLPLLVVATTAVLYGALAHLSVLRGIGFFRGATEAHARQFLWPPKTHLTEPEDYARRILAALPPDADLYAGWGEGAVIRYLQDVNGVRGDVEVHLLSDLDRVVADTTAGHRRYVSAYPNLSNLKHLERYPELEVVIPGALWRIRVP